MTRLSLSIVLVMLLLAPATAFCQSDFAISVGATRSTAETLSPGTGVATTLSDDFSGTGARIALDWRRSPWLGFRAGWTRYGTSTGEVSFPVACPGSCPPGTPPDVVTIDQEGGAFWLAYTPSVVYERWIFDGSVGVMQSEIRTVHVGNNFTQRSRRAGLQVGAGAEYRVTSRLGLRADAELLGDEASLVALSVRFRF
jgi:opacity protein-like surface antigen